LNGADVGRNNVSGEFGVFFKFRSLNAEVLKILLKPVGQVISLGNEIGLHRG